MSPMPLFDEECMLEECEKLGIKPQHCYTMWRYIIQKGILNIDEIPDLPKALYQLVKEKFSITTSKVIKSETSKDGSATKLMVQLQDGKLVESVIMRYGAVQFAEYHKDKQKQNEEITAFRSKPRATLCVSSQVGCQMGCTFCATGTMGLTGNLTSGEILEQLYHANKFENILNIVFMGMGEPLDNYEAVLAAINGMSDVKRFHIARDKISISTVGVTPRIRSLATDLPGISLALSLHAPTQELRSTIVPSSKAWHIDRIMEATDYFLRVQNENGAKHWVLTEYVLIANVNDSEITAKELGELLQSRPMYVLNVIPYNPTKTTIVYETPSSSATNTFCEIVRSYGVRVILRQELGQDIAGACGQLVITSQQPGGSMGITMGVAGANCVSQVGDVEDLCSPEVQLREPGSVAKNTGRKGDAKKKDAAGVNPTGTALYWFLVFVVVIAAILGGRLIDLVDFY